MTESYVYLRYPKEIGQKLNFGTYHPERLAFFQRLQAAAKRSGYDIDDLGNLVNFLDEKIDPQQYPDTEFSYLGLENMESDTGRVISYQKLLGTEIHSASSAFDEGCILFARLRPYLNKVHYARQSGIGSGELYIIKAKEKRVSPSYLLTYLLSDMTLNQTKWILSGSSYPRLGKDDFLQLKVVFPKDTSEQIRLVRIARRVEREATRCEKRTSLILGANRNMILHALNLKMLRIDVDYYPIYPSNLDSRIDYVRNHPLAKATDAMLKRVGAVALGSLIEDEMDYGVNAFGKEEGETPFINVQNLSLDGIVDVENIAYVDRPNDKKLLRKDDILISRSRTVGTCGLVREDQEGSTFGSYVLRMRVRKDAAVLPMYLVNFINSDLGQLQVSYLQTGSRGTERGGGNNINPDQIRKIGIVLPDGKRSVSKQRAIVSRITANLARAGRNRGMARQKWKEARAAFLRQVLGRPS